MEKHTDEIEPVTDPVSLAEYTIGTIHIANEYKSYGMGKYNIEAVQAGGDNTFTDMQNLNPQLTADDLFYVGDTFTVEACEEFFHKGLRDDGNAFGYTVEIVSIDTDASGIPVGTICITAK